MHASTRKILSQSQKQTKEAFGFKWQKRDTFEGAVTTNMRRWLMAKYGDVTKSEWIKEHGSAPVLLDAGCGAAMSGLALWEGGLDRINYIGVDISAAIDVAKKRFDEKKIKGSFIQCDLQTIPLPNESVDLIFSEGVLHHTDNTERALCSVVKHLKVNGRIMFYVYRKKGPIREFTDDHIRDKLQNISPEEGWREMQSLSKLGMLLGELDIEIDIPDDISVLDIPKGRLNLQRFFYWHVCKTFYRPEMTLDEMVHINYDWFAPKNAHRHTEQEVRKWCQDLNLTVEREIIEEAGITIIAQKKG